MAKLTINVPDEMKDWVAAEVDQGRSQSTDALVRRALRQERERRDPEYKYSDDDILDMLDEARASGIAPVQSVDEIFAEAMRRVAARRDRVA